MAVARMVLIAVISVLIGACGLIYKVDINQGNLLDQQAVDDLKVGMSKRQVLLVMGSPSIQSPFHQSRWDYTASVSRRGGAPEVRTLTLSFDGDSLASIDGDFLAGQEDQLLEDAQRLRGSVDDALEEGAVRTREARDREE